MNNSICDAIQRMSTRLKNNGLVSVALPASAHVLFLMTGCAMLLLGNLSSFAQTSLPGNVPDAYALPTATLFSKYKGLDLAKALQGQRASLGDTDSPMYHAPFIPAISKVVVFHPHLKKLWLKALDRPEAALRCQAIQALASAYQKGMPHLQDIPALLIKIAKEPGQPRRVKMTVLEALVVFENPVASDVLLAANASDSRNWQAVLLTDPLLAKWQNKQAVARWVQRVGQQDIPLAVRISAAGALGQWQAAASKEMLGALLAQVENTQAGFGLRIACARSLGLLQTQGLETQAKKWAQGNLLDRLIGASLLRYHSSSRAKKLLFSLLDDTEPAVVAIALKRLGELDPFSITNHADQLISSDDSNVRQYAAIIIARWQNKKAVILLATLLNDPIRDLRQHVRRILVQLHQQKKSLRSIIIKQAMRALATKPWSGMEKVAKTKTKAKALNQQVANDWRRLEQAAMLLGAAKHQAAANALVKLLAYPRMEVRVAVAAALGRLQVPDTLEPIVQYATQLDDQMRKTKRKNNKQPRSQLLLGVTKGQDVDQQLAQLFQLVGMMRYQQADRLLRKFIPKSVSGIYGTESRTAAIWALGLMHENRYDPQLGKLLLSRLTDNAPLSPEAIHVRAMSAVTLGLMNAKEMVSKIGRVDSAFAASNDIRLALRWALHRITGQTFEPLPIGRSVENNWFLVPTQAVEDEQYWQAVAPNRD